MADWNSRLKSKMKELVLTQEELAHKLGVTRSAVAHYVQGTRHPPLKQFVKLAMVLKTDPAWLQFGSDQPVTVKQGVKKSYTIPVLDWNQVTSYSPNHTYAKKLEIFNANNIQYYAVQIKGDAMASSTTQNISFNQGSYAIIDPDKIPNHGDFVIANTGKKKEPILRQYIEEGGIIYLKPLNTQYGLLEIEKGIKILGVVIAQIDFPK